MRRVPQVRSRRSVPETLAKSIPAPIGGWNLRDPLANMPEKDALVLDDCICRPGQVETRKGQLDYMTGLSSTLESLLVYHSATSQKMFAASVAGIYDASAAGVFGGIVKALTNGQVEYINFSTAGGSYLLGVNGADPMLSYDGTTWTDAAITGAGIVGFTTHMFNTINQFKHRVFLTSSTSLSFFYLGIDSIAGAVTEYPLGQLFAKGGSLLACLNWTIDGGSGADDYCCFMTTEGQLAIYKGTDPSSANTWALQGVFDLPRPVGKKCLFKYGGDVLITTVSGVYPLSKALLSSSIDRSIALSDKISPAFLAASAQFGTIHGWETQLYSEESILFFNIPTSVGVSAFQYVMNTMTGAWSRFTGFPATAFAQYKGNLYYATVGKVVQALTGVSDNGSQIQGYIQQAYTYLGTRGHIKHVEQIRPILQLSGAYQVGFGLAVDYETPRDFFLLPSVLSSSAALWDTAVWDFSTFGYDITSNADWRTVAAREGTAISLLVKMSSSKTILAWTATDFGFVAGTLVG